MKLTKKNVIITIVGLAIVAAAAVGVSKGIKAKKATAESAPIAAPAVTPAPAK